MRSGQIVIFPRYQADRLTPPADFLANALSAVRDALDVLETSPVHIRPDRRRFALIGHSAGGNLAAQMAAVAAENGLPLPRAVVAVMPGRGRAEPRAEPGQDPRDDPAGGRRRRGRPDRGRPAGAGDLRRGDGDPPVRGRSSSCFGPTCTAGWSPITSRRRPRRRGFNNGDGLLLGLQFSRARVDAFDRAGFWRLADITIQAGFRGRTLDEATDHGALVPPPGLLERRPRGLPADRRRRPLDHPPRLPRQRPAAHQVESDRPLSGRPRLQSPSQAASLRIADCENRVRQLDDCAPGRVDN